MISTLKRGIRAATDPQSTWRELFQYGVLDRHRAPREWFRFRHSLNRLCALRRQPVDGPLRISLSSLFNQYPPMDAHVRYIDVTPYSLSWEETVAISQLTAWCKPNTLFEFGTFDGRTTIHLAMNATDRATTYTIDVQRGPFEFGADSLYFRRSCVGEHFLGTPYEDRIRMLTADSRSFDYAPFRGRMDLIFIDADHSYSAVVHDSARAFEMIRPGGLVIWHDYLTIPDVTAAIQSLAKQRDLRSVEGTSLVVWIAPGAAPSE